MSLIDKPGAQVDTIDDRIPSDRNLTYVMAFNEAVRQSMREDDTVFCAGEDIGAFGGVFGTYGGLQKEFGERRVVDTPISEQAIVGLGVGAAVTGLRPIVDLMFMDFICVAMDQIVNQAAKLKYMFGGKAQLALTITTAGGGGLSAAAQHSQSLEALLCHIPGLKVVYPSNAYDMKGLMVSCIRENNPTVMVKHKRLLGTSTAVPEALYSIPLGKACVTRRGADVTVVAFGKMAADSLLAAEKLAAEGIECEVIDPRTLQPLDTATIVESARKTNRVIVVHEAVRFGGLGAEIAAQVQEEAFDYLDAPVARIGAPFSPVPFSPALEGLYIPSVAAIADGIRSVLGRKAPGA
jgi:pyruvate dehydrogenase E1 component beta subunit